MWEPVCLMDLIADGCVLIWSQIAFTIIHMHFLLPTIINGRLLILCSLFSTLSVLYAGKNVRAFHTFHSSDFKMLASGWKSSLYEESHSYSKPKGVLHYVFSRFYSQMHQQHHCRLKCFNQILWALNKKRRENGALTSWMKVGNMMSDFSTSKLTSSRGHWFANRCRINLQWLLVLFSASKFNKRWRSPATALTAASCQLTPMAC